MLEHIIPEFLLENIRAGRAALVVGAGVGALSWKQVLELMNERLRKRGQPGDAKAAEDVDKLLDKGSLTRAAGFLARSLGEEICDQVVLESWATQGELPALARVLARLPFKQIWTTFPGDVIELAVKQNSPEDWPDLMVKTYSEIGEVHRRRRTLVKIFGDFDSYIVTPKSVRKALSSASAMREYVRDFYAEGSLVFVGFRFADPDFNALLDRVFGTFEPPEREHYLLAAGAGPVIVEELMSEHQIKVINLPGQGDDDTATGALFGWLTALAEECQAQGISLNQARPDEDDLEGWVAVLADDPQSQEAMSALDHIEARAQESGESERLVELLLARVEHEETASMRGAHLRHVAQVLETKVGDIPRALVALTAALREEPAADEALDAAERLARDSDGWSDLVAEVAEFAAELEDRELAAKYWTRLGRWYDEELHHVDYAIAAYREAIKKSITATAAHEGLVDVFQRQQRWSDLADALNKHLDVEVDIDKQVKLNLALGELYETQLSSESKAVKCYELAAELDEKCDDAFLALERVYRKSERWRELARILEHRAALFSKRGDEGRSTALRGELAQLRADKLGDIDDLIRKVEIEREQAPGDRKLLFQLEELYEKAGRPEDRLQVLCDLVDRVPSSEQKPVLARLARAAENHGESSAPVVIVAHRKWLAAEPDNQLAREGLVRALRKAELWAELVAELTVQLELASAPVERATIVANIAEVYSEELGEHGKAIDRHLQALEECQNFDRSLSALSKLYRVTENWDRVLCNTVTHAKAKKDADLWREAGELACYKFARVKEAREYYEEALSLDRRHKPTLLALAKLHEQVEEYEHSAERILDAEAKSQDRAERIALLLRAGNLFKDKQGDVLRALAIFRKVLELDNQCPEALASAAEVLCAEERWKEALPYLEWLAAEKAAGEETRALRLGTVADAHAGLGQHDKAAARYAEAMALDPDNVDIAICAIDAKMRLAADGEAETLWREIETLAEKLVERDGEDLSAEQSATVWNRVGVAALKGGDDEKAESAFKKSLVENPQFAPSLSGLIDVSVARGNYETVVQAKLDLLSSAEGPARADLMEQIGDVYAEHLGDKEHALTMYLDALKITAESYSLLHKVLEIYSEGQEWTEALRILDILAGMSENPRRKAKYRYTAAVVVRDEVKDLAAAAERFELCLNDDPENLKAFNAIDEMYSKLGDYTGLARAYKRLLKRGGDAPLEQQIAMWSRLGEIFIEQLDDIEGAIAAFEVASQLLPMDMERHEQLANLYLEVGAERHDDAIRELQVLLRETSDRVEFYHALYALYGEMDARDKAFCVAQALVLLGSASEQQQSFYRELRPKQLILAKRKLTEELWQKAIIHERENRHLNAIFASVVGAFASTTAQPPSVYNLDAAERANLEEDQHAVSKIFKYSSEILALEPRPSLYVRDGGEDALRVANTAEEGRLMPAIFAGGAHAAKTDVKDLAFELGKRLAYFRPERYVNFAMSGLSKVEQAFAATLAATGAQDGEPADVATSELADTLHRLLPRPVLEQVGAVVRRLGASPHNGIVTGWRTATDLTANRVGLILCNDLTTAARLIAQESAPMSTLSTKDRLRDLIAYSASEEYFAVRRHLGLTVT